MPQAQAREVAGAETCAGGMPAGASSSHAQEWFVYVIGADDGSLYAGITTDLARRWQQHVSGTGAKYFRGRRPVAVVYLERGHDRASAARRELAIKRLSRAAKLKLLDSSANQVETAAQPLPHLLEMDADVAIDA